MQPTQTIYGMHAVRVMLERHPARVMNVLLAERREDPRGRAIGELAQRQGRPLKRMNADALKRLLGDVTHQGVAAEALPGQTGPSFASVFGPSANPAPPADVRGSAGAQPRRTQQPSGSLDGWLIDRLFGRR